MLRKFTLLITLLVLVIAVTGIASAQGEDDDTTTTTDEVTSNFTMFGVICADRAVINLSGTMENGFDIYYQVFGGAGGTGTALTALRRANVSGNYTFSEVVTYNDGGTVAAGGFGSFYVAIAREGDPTATIENGITYIDDIQDGCAEPQNPLGASTVQDGSAPGGTGATPNNAGTTTDGTSAILSPFGGVLNPGYVPPRKEIALVGERDEFIPPRQQTPGLVFAECDDYDVAEPGIIYDTDTVVIFWSWFAETEEQLIDHINNVNYSVTYYQVLPLPNPTRTEIRQINGLYWVFYYSIIGNLRPGQYWIAYKVDWDAAITDGFSEFGPRTANPQLESGCSFDVLENPEGRTVSHARWPYFTP